MSGRLLDSPCGSVHPQLAQLICSMRVGHGGPHAGRDVQWAAGPGSVPSPRQKRDSGDDA
jgi:hypothetical protein